MTVGGGDTALFSKALTVGWSASVIGSSLYMQRYGQKTTSPAYQISPRFSSAPQRHVHLVTRSPFAAPASMPERLDLAAAGPWPSAGKVASEHHHPPPFRSIRFSASFQ